MKNEILEEVWRNRDAFANEYDYDLERMVAALQEMEARALNPVVDRRDKKPPAGGPTEKGAAEL